MRKDFGQAGILVLVVMGVLVTIVLSVSSRSLYDTVFSRREYEGSEAFNMAERAVEEALKTIREGSTTGDVFTSGDFEGEYLIQESSFDLFVPELVVAEIDVTGYSDVVTVSWVREGTGEEVTCSGEGSGNAPAALEVIKLLDSGSVEREYYNAYNCSLGNSFASSSTGSSGFLSEVTIDATGVSYLRFKPVYNGATLKVAGSGLSDQMYLIGSTGTSPEAQKEIEVKRSRNYPASIFDFALFTGGAIVK